MKRGSVLLVILVVILIVVVFAAWFFFYNHKNPSAAVTPSEIATSTPNIVQVSFAQLPSSTVPLGIPADLPTPADADLAFNGSVPVTPTSDPSSNILSTQQAMRGYVTAETPSQLYSAYNTYFHGAGWSIVSSVSTGTIRSIDAQSIYFADEVIVTIGQNPASGKSMVNIAATYTPVLINGFITIGPTQIP